MNDLPTSGADKPHNARAILRDYQALGDTLWSRFNGGKEGTLWYYRTIADHYIALDVGPLAEKLKRVVTRLEKLAGDSGDKSGKQKQDIRQMTARGKPR